MIVINLITFKWKGILKLLRYTLFLLVLGWLPVSVLLIWKMSVFVLQKFIIQWQRHRSACASLHGLFSSFAINFFYLVPHLFPSVLYPSLSPWSWLFMHLTSQRSPANGNELNLLLRVWGPLPSSAPFLLCCLLLSGSLHQHTFCCLIRKVFHVNSSLAVWQDQ